MGEPSRLEKAFLATFCPSSSVMTTDSRFCQNPCCNLFSPISEADKLVGATLKATIAGINSFHLLYFYSGSCSNFYKGVQAVYKVFCGKPRHIESSQISSQSREEANPEHNSRTILRPSVLPTPITFCLQPCFFFRANQFWLALI